MKRMAIARERPNLEDMPKENKAWLEFGLLIACDGLWLASLGVTGKIRKMYPKSTPECWLYEPNHCFHGGLNPRVGTCNWNRRSLKQLALQTAVTWAYALDWIPEEFIPEG